MYEKPKEDAISAMLEGWKTIEELAAISKVKVTENQLKVMANKYLRGDSVELWMRRIARNIALADLLYNNELPQEEILEGVQYQIMRSENDQKAQMLLLQIRDLKRNERIANFRKF